MTVETDTSSILHQGNGVTESFAVPFYIGDYRNIQVTRIVNSSGAGTVLSPSEYLVYDTSNPLGGSVDYLYLGLPLPSTHSLLIERIVPFTQTLSLQNEQSFNPDAYEAALDKLTMMVQQLKADLAKAVSGNTITSITQNVSGPSGAVDGEFVLFDGNTGRLLKSSARNVNFYAQATHFHAWSDLTAVPTTLAGYGITDFTEASQDAVAAALAAGTHTNISVVYDDTNNKLSLICTVGADVWTELSKPNDLVITSNVTLANDPDLFFSMEANKTYIVEGSIFADTITTSGFKMAMTGPASPVKVFCTLREMTMANAETNVLITSFTTMRAVSYGANGIVHQRFHMIVKNGINPGTFNMQFAQNVSNINPLTIMAGSRIRYRSA